MHLFHKTIKNSIAILLTCLLFFTLPSCSSNNNQSEISNSNTSENKSETININDNSSLSSSTEITGSWIGKIDFSQLFFYYVVNHLCSNTQEDLTNNLGYNITYEETVTLTFEDHTFFTSLYDVLIDEGDYESNKILGVLKGQLKDFIFTNFDKLNFYNESIYALPIDDPSLKDKTSELLALAIVGDFMTDLLSNCISKGTYSFDGNNLVMTAEKIKDDEDHPASLLFTGKYNVNFDEGSDYVQMHLNYSGLSNDLIYNLLKNAYFYKDL